MIVQIWMIAMMDNDDKDDVEICNDDDVDDDDL